MHDGMGIDERAQSPGVVDVGAALLHVAAPLVTA